MASTFTLTKKGKTEVQGTKKIVEWELDCTSYDATNGGIQLTPARLGLKSVEKLIVFATEKAYFPLWTGGTTTPTIKIYGQEPTNATSGAIVLTEEADTTDVGTLRVLAYGK